MSGGLRCPRCGTGEHADERFCRACGMPLVRSGDEGEEASERRRRARRIKPQYTEGELVKVAYASNLVEAEFIEGILLDAGIPCVLRAQIAGYAPLAGTREVLVAASGAQAAREALEPRARA